MTLTDWLAKVNGPDADDGVMLAHATEIPIRSERWPIVLLCNSVASSGAGWLGVLHQAELALEPRGERMVNTVHLGARSMADANASEASAAWDDWVAVGTR